MVNEPVKTIIDHGLTMVDHGQKTNSTIIDHELTMTNQQWLTMVNHGQSVVALTTMTIVINDGLNEWVDHGQPWPEYWLWLPLRASDLLTWSLMAKVATDRPWLTTANHGQLVMVTSWSMMAWTVIDQDTTMISKICLWNRILWPRWPR